MATRTLTVKLVGDHKNLDRAFGAAGRSAQKFGRLAGAAIAGVGVAAAGLSIDAVRRFAGFESAMNEVFTLLPGISGAAMDEMAEQVKSLAADMGVLPDDVVPALYQALSAGVPPDNVFEFLETATKLSIGGLVDLETAVDGISSVVNAYGADVISSAEASDIMFTAVKLGKTTVDELASSLFNVTPTASSLGVEFGNVAAGMAALTAQGVPTSVASTQLRQLMVELAKDGGKAATAFEDMAGQSFPEFIAAGGDLAGALDVMGAAADESGVRIADMFGSVEAGAAAGALFDNQTFTDALAEMGSSAGATDAAFEQMDQGVQRSLDKLRAKFSVVMLDLGERLAPMAIAALDWLIDTIDRLSPTIDRLAEAFSENGLGGMLSEAARMFGELWPVILEKLGELASNLLAWVVETAPVVGAQLLVWGQQFWEWVSPQIGPMLSKLAELAARLYVWIVEQSPKVLEKLLELGVAFTEWIVPQIPGMLEKLGEMLAALTTWVVTVALPALVQSLGEMAVAMAKAAMEAFFQVGLDIVSGVWNGIAAKWDEFAGWFSGKISGLADSAKGLLKIFSPSKVFFAIGGNVMDGLADGMDKTYRMNVQPTLAGAVGGLAGTMSPLMGRSGVTGDSGRGAAQTIIIELDSRVIGRGVVRAWERDGGAPIKIRAGG